ncbi:aldose 1-epimerase family protein [bacterium]|nr:aldose 1-epimerase family protein [bacterium]
MTRYASPLDFAEQMERAGRAGQLWGAVPFVYEDGAARGARGIAVNTGGGLSFTLLPDRGLDAYDAHYCGTPLAWLSAAGPVHPAYYQESGALMHRSWPAGLFSTCGLRHAGQALTDGGEYFGLHGRYASLPAENVTIHEDTSVDPPQLVVSGRVRECQPITGPNLVNHRSITVTFGRSEFKLRDSITNEGNRAEEILVVYHLNFGHPLLSERTRLAAKVKRSWGYNELTQSELGRWREYGPPERDYEERVYFHEPEADGEGRARVLLYNSRLGDGLGVEICVLCRELPYLSQWKMLSRREYVTGIEPGTGFVLGRKREREAGRLVKLQPGQTHSIGFTLLVHTGEDLEQARAEIEG